MVPGPPAGASSMPWQMGKKNGIQNSRDSGSSKNIETGLFNQSIFYSQKYSTSGVIETGLSIIHNFRDVQPKTTSEVHVEIQKTWPEVHNKTSIDNEAWD